MQGSFRTHKSTHHKGRKIILNGTMDKSTELWKVPLENKNPKLDRDIEHGINRTYHIPNRTDLFKYLHVEYFSPFKKTYIREIRKRHFQSWPGLTVKIVTKYFPNIVPTSKGHIKNEKKNVVNKDPI